MYIKNTFNIYIYIYIFAARNILCPSFAVQILDRWEESSSERTFYVKRDDMFGEGGTVGNHGAWQKLKFIGGIRQID